MIRQLQAELRAEEAKLVLLKKMKLTQSMPASLKVCVEVFFYLRSFDLGWR